MVGRYIVVGSSKGSDRTFKHVSHVVKRHLILVDGQIRRRYVSTRRSASRIVRRVLETPGLTLGSSAGPCRRHRAIVFDAL